VNVIRGTFRPWVVVALIVWMVGVGIAVLFRGSGVRTIIDNRGTGNDWPWEAIWLLGILVIIAIGFLTRKRA
jgi:hypothetical protein